MLDRSVKLSYISSTRLKKEKMMKMTINPKEEAQTRFENIFGCVAFSLIVIIDIVCGYFGF